MTAPSEGEHRVDDIARAWLTKMRGPDADAVREEFDAWIGSASAHRDAYEQARQQLAASAILKASARYGSAHAEKRRGWRAGWMPGGIGAALAALFVVAIGTGTMGLPGLDREGTSTAHAAIPLTTTHGEIRTFALSDGSSVTLDTDSQALVTLGSDRRLQLLGGRARLRIAAQADPMRIEAGAISLSSEGAEIDIGIDGAGEVKLLLTSGAARLATGLDPSRAKPLAPGRTLAFKRDGKQSAYAKAIPRTWPEGWADYRSVRLSELVAEANRYASPPLVLDDPALGSLELSGRFRVNQTEHLAQRIGQLFDLAIEQRADGIHLRRR